MFSWSQPAVQMPLSFLDKSNSTECCPLTPNIHHGAQSNQPSNVHISYSANAVNFTVAHKALFHSSALGLFKALYLNIPSDAKYHLDCATQLEAAGEYPKPKCFRTPFASRSYPNC